MHLRIDQLISPIQTVERHSSEEKKLKWKDVFADVSIK